MKLGLGGRSGARSRGWSSGARSLKVVAAEDGTIEDPGGDRGEREGAVWLGAGEAFGVVVDAAKMGRVVERVDSAAASRTN